MTLTRSEEVRAGKESSFRSYKEQVVAVKKLNMEWKETSGRSWPRVAQTKERK